MAAPVVGQTIYVDRRGDSERGHARILDMNDTAFIIDVPMILDSSTTLTLEERAMIQVSYRAVDGSMCYFDSIVVGHEKMEYLPCIRIVRPKNRDITRIQRREFARIEVPIEVALLVIRGEGSPRLVTGRGTTKDISGGGLSFFSERKLPIEAGDTLTLKFAMMDENGISQSLSAKAVLIRHHEDDNGRDNYSVKFTEIIESAQQKIIQFVFRMQLKSRSSRG